LEFVFVGKIKQFEKKSGVAKGVFSVKNNTLLQKPSHNVVKKKNCM
jgi:hypothetical protein